MYLIDLGLRKAQRFTPHPHMNHACLYSPASKHHRPLDGTYCAYPRRDDQAELTWVAELVVDYGTIKTDAFELLLLYG